MEEKKTVIWHGGLEALLASDAQPVRTGVEARARESSVHEANTAVEEIDDLAARLRQAHEEADDHKKTEIFTPAPRFDSYRNRSSGTRVMGSWALTEPTAPAPEAERSLTVLAKDHTQDPPALAKGADPAATRIHPIETLFPAQTEPKPEASTNAQMLAKRPESEETGRVAADASSGPVGARSASQVGLLHRGVSVLNARLAGPQRERVFLYGALLAACGVALGLRVLHQPSDGPSLRESVPTQVAPQVAPASLEEPLSESKVAEPAPPATKAVAKQGLERAAADALARGDFALAQRIYGELAASSPQNPAFREAARILVRASTGER
jgi:hypothetical protein